MNGLAKLSTLSTSFGVHTGLFWLLFAVVIVWSLVLKGFALWNAARNHQRAWFIVILILNTFGILEIIYLIWFRKNNNPQPTLFGSEDATEDDSSSSE